MRIIAGQHKGLPIPMPKGGDIRPTTDRAKEALFSMLTHQYDFESIKVLDLFAGSGNISFEFASRGCSDVIAVEKNRRVLKQSEQFAKDKNISGIRFTAADVMSYVKRSTEQFDIIFADPPYHLSSITQLPSLIHEHQLLTNKGLLVIEHESTLHWDNPFLVENRKYGQSVFSMFQFDVSLNT